MGRRRGADVGAPAFGVADTSAGYNNAANTHTIDLPAGIVAGDLLLLMFNTRDNRTFTAPSGWTKLVSAAGPPQVSVAYKVADGGEGASTTCSTSSTASRSAYVVMRIVGYQGTPQISAGTTGSSTAPDPASISPAWGTASATLFIATYGARNVSGPTAIPAGYSDEVTGVNATDPVQATATKIATLASENPGAFTTATSNSWNAYTIAVRSA